MHDLDVDRLLNLAAGCEEAIRQRAADLAHLQEELQGLDGRTCNGREWWRDKDKPTRAPKLYILHSVNQTCPVHGEPRQDDRLRVYVGSERARIREAREAIERERRRRELQAKAAEIRRGLSSCGYHLRSLYGLLDYQVGEDGQAEPR